MSLFRKKRRGSPLKELLTYHGRKISYASEHFGCEENIIGKNGGINVDRDFMVIMCDGREVFRCLSKNASVFTLMSGNGCDIKGFDENEKRNRHIIAYYSEWKQ